MTLDDERGALGSWKISNQLQWLGFGLLVSLRASTAIKRLDCAPSSLYELPYAVKAKVRSSVSLLLTKVYRAFHLRASRISLLRLSESISELPHGATSGLLIIHCFCRKPASNQR